MNEDYITFKTAKLAKEKGFNIQTRYYYDFIGDIGSTSSTDQNWNKSKETIYSRPTQSALQKWLREKHKVFAESVVDQRGSANHRLETYFTCVIKYRRNLEFERRCGFGQMCYKTFPKYEEAIEEALYESLRQLDKLTYKNSTK